MAPVDLSSLPLFSSLPVDEIRRLENLLEITTLPAGRVLLCEGQTGDEFYFLLEGRVEIVKALDLPEERQLGVREAGSLLGEMSLFNADGCHTASARSLSPLKLLRMPHAELDILLHRQPQIAYDLLSILSQRLEESENNTILDLKEKNQRLEVAYASLKAAQLQVLEKERLEKELEISGQIQQSLLPKSLPAVAGYEIGALMVPARSVGGDFFNCFKLDGGHLGVLVGDVADKGVPAALFMALAFSAICIEARRNRSPVQALRKVNRHLLGMNSSKMFVTLIYGILELSSGIFHFARAAHPSPYILTQDGRVVDIPVSSGQPLGLFSSLPLDEQIVSIPPGGILLLYSDGLSEAQDINGRDFAPDSLYRSLASNRSLPAAEICGSLWKDVKVHGRGLPQQDDFTSLVVKRQRLKE